MSIKEGNIYSLSGATDYPYCLALLLNKRPEGVKHIVIVYRAVSFNSNIRSKRDNFNSTNTSLYSILESQGRLNDLLPFIRHLMTTKSYSETCEFFGIKRTPVQQAPHYSGELVHPPSYIFQNKQFLPYASRLALLDFKPAPIPPSTFL